MLCQRGEDYLDFLTRVSRGIEDIWERLHCSQREPRTGLVGAGGDDPDFADVVAE